MARLALSESTGAGPAPRRTGCVLWKSWGRVGSRGSAVRPSAPGRGGARGDESGAEPLVGTPPMKRGPAASQEGCPCCTPCPRCCATPPGIAAEPPPIPSILGPSGGDRCSVLSPASLRPLAHLAAPSGPAPSLWPRCGLAAASLRPLAPPGCALAAPSRPLCCALAAPSRPAVLRPCCTLSPRLCGAAACALPARGMLLLLAASWSPVGRRAEARGLRPAESSTPLLPKFRSERAPPLGLD